MVTPAGRGYRARTRFRDLDGVTREVERSGATKGAARNALTGYLTERTTPAADAITAESLVRDVAAVWFAERCEGKRAIAENTRRRYREVIKDHVGPAVGSLRVREANVTRLDRFIKTVAADVGAPTAKLCATILRGVMGLAVRHGAAASNPMREVATVHVDHKEPRAMTFEEVTRAREAAARYSAGLPVVEGRKVHRGGSRATDLLEIVDVMLATGARIGEVLAIRWADVDLESGVLTVAGTVVASDTPAATPIRQPVTKGRKTLAYLLPAFGIEAIMRQRVAMTAANAEDLVFPSLAGTVRDPGNVRKTLHRVLGQVGLEWVTPHTFRKTVATVIEREADLPTATAQMGHSSEDVTRRHYVERAALGPDTRAITSKFVPASSND
ncbi:site-specific integrase [Nocardioides nanhaiensis]|uniref:Tyrosine-type recombinase/integrase n=1 Tax=Nocardioides nanhaiensis TaxID=1476871 RepID=A0ABP8W4A7_9ACTN